MPLHLYKWPSFVPFLWGSKPKSLQIVTAVMKLKDATPWEESYDQPRQHIKKQRHYFVNKNPSSQGYGFSSSHVWMWELNCKESWVLKNWCFWTVVVGEDSWESLGMQSMGSQTVGHDRATKLNWTECCWTTLCAYFSCVSSLMETFALWCLLLTFLVGNSFS